MLTNHTYIYKTYIYKYPPSVTLNTLEKQRTGELPYSLCR